MKLIQTTLAVLAVLSASNAFANGGHVDMAMADARFSSGDNFVDISLPASIKDDAVITFNLKEYLKDKYGETAQNWPYAIIKAQEAVLVFIPEKNEWVQINFAEFQQK